MEIKSVRVCMDVGGTFTDVVVVDEEGRVNNFKMSTTPDDFPRAAVDGLALAAKFYSMPLDKFMGLCGRFAGGSLIHGTTISTNAILQGNVAKVGLICTKGHRDILLWREGGKENPFDFNMDYPEPFVPRYLTFGVTERMTAEGEVYIPLDEDEVRQAVRQFKEYGVEVIAVALLWSIANPAHEKRIGEIIKEEWLGQPYVLSHEVNPVPREYRRTSSTVIDASLMPLAKRYISDFSDRLKRIGYKGEMQMLSASGGIISAKEVEVKPIQSIDCGPALAPIAGRHYAQLELNVNNVLTFDMGGTSSDVSTVTNGRIITSREAMVGAERLGIEKVDSRSIGAGGGSIAYVDEAGLIHVGPKSAEALPGPACYMRGGTEPTVSDADVVLGYLNPDYLLGKRMKLDHKLAEEVILQKVAKPLKLNLYDAAFTVWSTININMADAIRDITVWQGIDPREYVFVCGGGAAGMHLIPILEELEVKQTAIFPKLAGGLSAVGGIVGDMVKEFTSPLNTDSKNFNYDGVNEGLQTLEASAVSFFDNNNIDTEQRDLHFYVEARYPFQVWELPVPLRVKSFKSESDIIQLVNDFHDVHESVFATKEPEQYVEFCAWKVRAVGKVGAKKIKEGETGTESPPTSALKNKRLVYFKKFGKAVETPVYDGNELKAGNKITAPAIIEEETSTLVVFPGSMVTVSRWGNYLAEREAAKI